MNRQMLGIVVGVVSCVFFIVREAGACQDPARFDCCFHIYAAGVEMGVASSTLNYVIPGLWEEPTIRQLFAVGNEISISNTLCSCLGPAWSGLVDRLATLDRHADRIAKQGDEDTRRAVYHFTQGSVRAWAEDLNRVSVQTSTKKEWYRTSTCSETYWALGYHIGYAHHAFLVAAQSDHAGYVERVFARQKGYDGINSAIEAIYRLHKTNAEPQTWAGYCVHLWDQRLPILGPLQEMFLSRATPQMTDQQLAANIQNVRTAIGNTLLFGNPGLRVLACPGTNASLTDRAADVAEGRSFRPVAILNRQLEELHRRQQTRRTAQRFDKPAIGGVPLDGCLTWAKDCGKPAADEFCKRNGFTRSTGHGITSGAVPRSIVITSGKICETGKNWPYCGAFTYIDCVKE